MCHFWTFGTLCFTAVYAQLGNSTNSANSVIKAVMPHNGPGVSVPEDGVVSPVGRPKGIFFEKPEPDA